MQLHNTLHDLVRIPSVTGDAEACKTIIKFCNNFLGNNKVSSAVLSSAGKPVLVWGTTDLSKTKWLINSHLDVVPGETSQFIPREGKGKIWGRGAADTKGSCAVILQNAKTWEELALRKNVTFMLVVDEETGGDSTREISTMLSKLQGGIFLEPTGEKIVTQAKGIMQVKLTTKGKSAHGSTPWEGKNTIETLAHSLTDFRLHNPQFIANTKSSTFNFSQIVGGEAINQVPGKTSLMCDIRRNPADPENNLLLLLRTHFPDTIVQVVKSEPPINCDKSSCLFLNLSGAMRGASLNPLTAFSSGSSDARHLSGRKIPAIVFGPKGKNIHGHGEWVSTKSLDNVARVLSGWLKLI